MSVMKCECCDKRVDTDFATMYEVCEDCLDVRLADRSVGEVLAQSLTNAARADEAVRLLEEALVCLTTTFRDCGKRHDAAIAAIRAFLEDK